MTRRSLREDGHYEGVPTELILTSGAFPSCFYFSHRLWNGRRGDYIKSIFGQGMGRRRLGLQASSNNLPAGRHTSSTHSHTHPLYTGVGTYFLDSTMSNLRSIRNSDAAPRLDRSQQMLLPKTNLHSSINTSLSTFIPKPHLRVALPVLRLSIKRLTL
jgi:hypothetical protein